MYFNARGFVLFVGKYYLHVMALSRVCTPY